MEDIVGRRARQDDPAVGLDPDALGGGAEARDPDGRRAGRPEGGVELAVGAEPDGGEIGPPPPVMEESWALPARTILPSGWTAAALTAWRLPLRMPTTPAG